MSEELFLFGKCFVGLFHMIAGVRHKRFREIMSLQLEGVMPYKLIQNSDKFVASVLQSGKPKLSQRTRINMLWGMTAFTNE